MEQKRTLWILLASGIFLLVVIGAASIPYAQKAKRSSSVTSIATDSSYSNSLDNKDLSSYNQNIWDSNNTIPETPVDPFTQKNDAKIEIVENQSGNTDNSSENGFNQGGSTINTENLTIYASGTTSIVGLNKNQDEQEYTDINSDYNTEKTLPEKTTIDLNIHSYTPSYPSNVTSLNETAEKAMKKTADAYRETYENDYGTEEIKVVSKQKDTQTKKQTASVEDKSTKTPVKETVKKSSSVSSSKSENSKTSKAQTQSSNTKEIVQDRYWIQIASYASKKNADEARTILEENKLPCEVFTITDKEGKLLYRVRVGAYTTKSEAEYWKTKIIAIPLFSSSKAYVTNSSAQAK